MCGLSVLLCSACVDPEGSFNEFSERVGPPPDAAFIDSPFGDVSCVVDPAALTGSYLLALSVVVAPQSPIVALLDLAIDPSGATLSLSNVQALSAQDRRTPVGPPVSAGPFPVSGAVAQLDLPGLAVPGAANPISGQDIVADVVLTLNLCPVGTFLCGVADGMVTQPLQLALAGSTFTLSPATGGAGPEPPPIDCAGTLAAAP